MSENPRLKFTKNGVETIHPIHKDSFTIGRLGDSDLKIPDTYVSRIHAEIVRDGDQYSIHDRNSKSGTFVNEARITSQVLKHGDRILLSRSMTSELLFLEAGMEAPPEPQVPSLAVTSSFFTKDTGADLQHVSRFLEGVRHFSSGVPLQDVLDVVLDMAIDISGADRAFLILLDERKEPVFRSGRNRKKESLQADQFQITRSILQDVLKNGNRVVMTEDSNPGSFAQSESVSNLELRTVVCLPLRGLEAPRPGANEHGIIGALYLDSKTSRKGLSKISEGLLVSLANDAGSVVMNMQLLKEAREKQLLEIELETAREIQTSLLPDIHGAYGFFDVCAENRASRRISGDYYDLITLPDGRIAVVIADISGKGIPAAILASLIQGALFVEVLRNSSPCACIDSLNRFLVHRSGTNRFASLFLAILNPDGQMTYVNAGHNPPILLRASGETLDLTAHGVVLGVVAEVEYEEKVLNLEPGDLICMYTDGITEAVNKQNDFYGEERLLASLKSAAGGSAADVLGHVLDDVLTHTGDLPRNDDVTLLVVRRLSHQAGNEE